MAIKGTYQVTLKEKVGKKGPYNAACFIHNGKEWAMPLFGKNKELIQRDGLYYLEVEKAESGFYEIVEVSQPNAQLPVPKPMTSALASNAKDLQIEAAVIFKGAVELSAGKVFRNDEFRRLLGDMSAAYKDLLTGKLSREKEVLEEIGF